MGEGCFDLYARIIPPFLTALADVGIHSRMGGFVLDEAISNSTVAVFAHGGSLAVIFAHMLKIPPFPASSVSFEETGHAVINFTERNGIHYPTLVIPAPHSNNSYTVEI